MGWTVLALTLCVLGGATAVHLGVLALASAFYREPVEQSRAAHVRFLVLVHATGGDALNGTLESVHRERRPGDAVLVVGDHCADDTAQIADAWGAHFVAATGGVPMDGAGARQLGLVHAQRYEWDALVAIDAGAVIDPGFLDVCERRLREGRLVLQARVESSPGPGFFARAALVAFALQGVTVQRGRDRLGLSVRLNGTGFVLHRSIVERYRFRDTAVSPDLWFSLDLCADGILARHMDSARLRTDYTRSLAAAWEQRVGWETGRMVTARRYVGLLLRKHSPASFEAGLHLVTPPLAVAAVALLVAMIAAWMSSALVLIAVCVALAGLLVIVTAVALIQSAAEPRTWLFLAAAPAYMLWKLWVQLGALARLLRSRPLVPVPIQERDSPFG